MCDRERSLLESIQKRNAEVEHLKKLLHGVQDEARRVFEQDKQDDPEYLREALENIKTFTEDY